MKFCFLVLSVFFHSLVTGQDITSLLKEAARLEMVPDEKAALAKYKEVMRIQPLQLFAICRSSELCSRIGKRQTDTKLREDYFDAALTYANIALKVSPDDSEANCVMAIALGRSSMSKSGKEKINTAKEIKKYLDKSLQKDSTNYKAWHVLGRWHYEIANLSLLERAAVNFLYGGVPSASIKESVRCFEKAKTIAPWFILNYFEMARAYYDNDDKARAKEYINKMLSLPNVTEDDPTIKEKGKTLLKIMQ